MEKNGTILAVDTAVGHGSIALLKNGETVVGRVGHSQNSRSSDLITEVAELLEVSGTHRKEIDLIAVSIGPGSFTGTRIGIASARGLASALDCRFFGASMMDVLSAAYAGDNSSCVIIPGGRERFYFQFFQSFGNRNVARTAIKAGAINGVISQIKNIECRIIIMPEPVLKQITAFLQKSVIDFAIKVASDNLAVHLGQYCDRGSENLSIVSGAEILPLYVEEANI